MKHLFYALLACTFLLSSCEKSKEVKLTGQVLNQENDYVVVINSITHHIDSLKVTDGLFSSTINIDVEQHLYLSLGKKGLAIYVVPGDVIDLKIDMNQLKNKQLDKTEITGSNNTKLLTKIAATKQLIDLRALISLTPKQFDIKVKEYKQDVLASIDSFKDEKSISKLFLDKALMDINLDVAYKYNMYTQYHKRLAPQDTSEIPASFSEKLKDFSLDNLEYFKDVMMYNHHVVTTYTNQINETLNKENIDNSSALFLNKQIDAIIALDVAKEIKNELGTRLILSSFSRMPDSLQSVVEKRYAEIITNEFDLNEFGEKVLKMNALKVGNKAPGFSYPDIDGNLVSSESLKGKVIYIDVWATWCGPCKREIPYLKALESELHDQDIAFVSISVDDDMDAWKNMVKNDALQGYQLYAKKAWQSKIVKDYMISGIPRFIMLDKSGNVINVNATRPSNPETKATLLTYAKK